MSILITGSTGFVGTNLVDYLTDSNFILNKVSREQLSSVTPEIFNGTKAVVHLAGKAHDLKKVSDPHLYYEINFELTKKLYNAFLKSDAEKFIFISSVKAATDRVAGVLTEDITTAPQTDYGKSKLMAEQYIQSQHLPQGKSYYILRPCMIHGPGNKGNLNMLYQFVKKGIPYPLSSFNNERSFLSVKNLCFVIEQLIRKENVTAGIYHVADDQSLSTSEVIAILAASLNIKPKLWKVPARIIKSLAKLGDRLYLPLTTERLDKLTESYVVSNQKIKDALAVELPLSAKEGLIITANSFAGK